MADYTELIKRLRTFATWKEDGAVMDEAADAIEELSKLADAIPHVCECCVGCELEKKNGGCDHAFVLSPKRAMQYLIRPRWIPVAEGLPGDRQFVLVYCGDNKRIRPSDRFDVAILLGDSIFTSLGVTHWMPLPEPPKEETE